MRASLKPASPRFLPETVSASFGAFRRKRAAWEAIRASVEFFARFSARFCLLFPFAVVAPVPLCAVPPAEKRFAVLARLFSAVPKPKAARIPRHKSGTQDALADEKPAILESIGRPTRFGRAA